MSKKFQDTEEGKKQKTLFDDMDNFDWWKKEWKNIIVSTLQEINPK